MLHEPNAYAYLGHALARLPFVASLENVYSGVITEEELGALQRAFRAAVVELMEAGLHYQLTKQDIESCVHGFVVGVTDFLFDSRLEEKGSVQKMQVDGCEWELVFDPGPGDAVFRSDEKNRVWRKVISETDPDIPF